MRRILAFSVLACLAASPAFAWGTGSGTGSAGTGASAGLGANGGIAGAALGPGALVTMARTTPAAALALWAR